LLNANVAFLAIQSVDEGLGRRVDQVASYISVTMSVGSIILGLLLVRQNRTETRETANELVRILFTHFPSAPLTELAATIPQ